MQIPNPSATIFLIITTLTLLTPHFPKTQANYTKTLASAHHNATTSRFLTGLRNPRFLGCRRRPWICNREDFPRIRRLCCRNRCVDVTSDPNNCGLCGIRCPFAWQCCRGICINTNVNPFHCGRCDRRCPSRSFCFYGMCGYAQPLPPFPFPFPPRPPRPLPPFPFPFPPRTPKPHPFPPKPHPPKGGRPVSPPPPAVVD